MNIYTLYTKTGKGKKERLFGDYRHVIREHTFFQTITYNILYKSFNGVYRTVTYCPTVFQKRYKALLQ